MTNLFLGAFSIGVVFPISQHSYKNVTFYCAGISGSHAEDSHAEPAGWGAHRPGSAAVCPHRPERDQDVVSG